MFSLRVLQTSQLLQRQYSSMAFKNVSLSKIKGVVFDMDGTLTMPAQIDFHLMREKLGIPKPHDVLETVDALTDPVEKKRMYDIIEEVEDAGRKSLGLQPGLQEIFDVLGDHGLPAGLITRNSPRAVEHFLEVASSQDVSLKLDEVATRDFKPVKPHPAALNHMIKKWNLKPEEVLMVGDFRDDIKIGQDAGSLTCLIMCDVNKEFMHMPDLAVESLSCLADHIRQDKAMG